MSEESMYGFDESTKIEGGGNYIPAGIVENVVLQDVFYEPLKADGDGDHVLKFLFADNTGATFNHIEFPIEYKRTLDMAKGWGKTSAEAEAFVRETYAAQGERIKHILSCFIPRDKCVFKANSFKEFAEGVIALLGNAHEGVEVRIKTVYKKNSSYTTFPRRAFKPFIQPMSVPNKLRIDPKYDIIEPPTPDTSDNFSGQSNTAGDDNDAPW
jgi:hypothetical protein